MSNLEKKWWFTGIMAFFSSILAISLLKSAGIWPVSGFAQWLIYFICMVGCWRSLSFLAWLILLLAAPKSKALD